MPVEAVGAHLRDMRQRRGISLDEISRQTRVPFRYLEALEGNRLADLPALVFVRGFIRAYCQALGEPAEQALARLDARGSAAPARTAAAVVRRTTSAPAARTAEARSRTRAAALVSFVLLVVLGAALLSLTMLVHPSDERRPADALIEPDVSAVEQASPGPSPGVAAPPPTHPMDTTTTAPAPPSPPPAATKAAPGTAAPPSPVPAPVAPPPVTPAGQPQTFEAAYRLVARTTEATWIRVRTEDGRTTEETVPAWSVREWVSNRPFVLTVGNAGGVRLELNGTELPPLGASGAVISRLVVPAEPR